MTGNELRLMSIRTGIRYPAIAELLKCSRSTVAHNATIGDNIVPSKYEVLFEKMLGKQRYERDLKECRAQLSQEREERRKMFAPATGAADTPLTQTQNNDAHKRPIKHETDTEHPQLPFDKPLDDDNGEIFRTCPNCEKKWTELEIDCQECLDCGYSLFGL